MPDPFGPKFLLLACFLLPCAGGIAQYSPQPPHEGGVELAKEKLFCQPGVENSSKGRGLLLQYGRAGSFTYRPKGAPADGIQNSSVSGAEQVTAKIKIPLANKPGFKALLGYEYNAESFHISRPGSIRGDAFLNLDGNPLRSNKYSLYLTKSFDDKYYAGLRLRAAYRGDYDQGMSLDRRYATFSGLAVFGVKPRPDVEWGAGLMYSDNFFSRQLLPFIIYNQSFSDRWGIEAVLPVQVMGRYNFSPLSMLLFGAEYQSQSYAIGLRDGGLPAVQPYYFKHSEIALKASFDQHLYSWLWLNLEAGMLLPVQTRFEDAGHEAGSFQARAGLQPFCNLGLFLSPTENTRRR